MSDRLPSYREQFNKITEAYIRGEIKPYNAEFCFCGTIAGSCKWQLCSNGYNGYSLVNYCRMEDALLIVIKNRMIEFFPGMTKYADCTGDADMLRYEIESHPQYEEALFNGMCAALEVLKQIHIERGEVIDEDIPVFTKRELITAK
jgi:hypothetical protein